MGLFGILYKLSAREQLRERKSDSANLENDTENGRETLVELRGSVERPGAMRSRRAGERPANSQIRRVKRHLMFRESGGFGECL